MADENDTFDLAAEIEAGLREAVAHRRGEIALPSRHIEPLPPARVKAIRKKVSKSTKDFGKRYFISHRTVEGWEQGKKMDAVARNLLVLIEQEPKVVELALERAYRTPEKSDDRVLERV